MGLLLNYDTGTGCTLIAEQIVGRASDCSLRVDKTYVSGHHAEIRWSGQQWQLKDLGSRNGTFVNNERLARGEWRALQQGDVASFGDPNLERWALASDVRPQPALVPVGGGAPIPIEGILGIPPEAPEATVWLDAAQGWRVELPDKPASPLEHGSIFSVGSARYQLCCEQVSPTTELLQRGYLVGRTHLELRHSLDEEYVEAVVEADDETRLSLGDRQHHAVLLALARQRLEDREQGVPEGSCGWMYIEDLMDRLKLDRPQLNLHVYRARQQFLAVGFRDATEAVERRLQTKQVRLGFSQFRVTRL